MRSENAAATSGKDDDKGECPLSFPLQTRCHYNVNGITILIIFKVITGFEL